MAIAIRHRALTDTLPSPSTPRFSNFRPIRYQTKEELDRFFGSTSAQRREQRLRVRESDGQVYFDWIEKEEWQHLLSPASEKGEGGRRRSSALTLNSPLSLASPRRGSTPITPLERGFQVVDIGGEGEQGRRGRKRSQTTLARNTRVDDETPLTYRDWVHAPAFKRRQSDSPRASLSVEEADRIRISRLPLARRRLDRATLDAAFGVDVNPLFDLTPNPTLAARGRRPSALHIPQNNSVQVEDRVSPITLSPPRSPMSLGGSTFDNGTRRGTFGVQQGQVLTGSTPPSAAMEFLLSPLTPNLATQQRSPALRHAVSFDTPRTPSFNQPTYRKTVRVRGEGYHSADETERGLRGSRSVASLRERKGDVFASARSSAAAAVERRRETSSASESSGSEGCFTSLAPRTGAKKYDRTRTLHLNIPSPPPATEVPALVDVAVEAVPMRDALSTLSTLSTVPRAATRGTGLRTGPHVYQDIDIPCASIHLHSDPEDNLDPGLTSGERKKQLKKRHGRRGSTVGSLDTGRGGRRGWWGHILNGS